MLLATTAGEDVQRAIDVGAALVPSGEVTYEWPEDQESTKSIHPCGVPGGYGRSAGCKPSLPTSSKTARASV